MKEKMHVDLHNELEEIAVRIRSFHSNVIGVDPRKFYTMTIRRGDDSFTMYCDEKTDIQVLIDLLKTEARKIGAYIDE